MRECWVNVYVLGSGRHALGRICIGPNEARRSAQSLRDAGVSGPAYRLHVRLKQEPWQYVAVSSFNRDRGFP